jgi:hypothetical protein
MFAFIMLPKKTTAPEAAL